MFDYLQHLFVDLMIAIGLVASTYLLLSWMLS